VSPTRARRPQTHPPRTPPRGEAGPRAPGAAACRMCGAATTPACTVGGYRFVECGRCRFVFAPAITAEFVMRLYEEGYHGPGEGAPEVGWANTEFLEPTLERLDGRGPLEILDFGAGQSGIPDLLRERGHRVVAVDVAPPLRPHPDRLTGDLLELGLAADRFDLAFSFQVIEHLPEPRPYLEELLRLTRPGGLVLLHTDMEVPEREGAVEGWWYVMPPDHCSFFRHRTFEVFLKGTPHRIIATTPKSVTLQVGPA
jgi:SAM-dependent methyltransferase